MSNKGRQAAEKLPQTGTCYQDAWRFVIKEEEGYLVHGTVWSRDKRIGHAWVETETGWIWEPETGRYFTSLGFIDVFAPDIESRYTPEEAAIMAARTNHHGPWTEQERHQYLVVKQLQTVPKKTTLRVVCAYCGKYIRSVPGYGVSGVSHGICEECATVEWEKLIDHIAQTRGITRDEARKLVERGKMSPMAATTKSKPTRHDVEIGTWAERDRMGIWLTDKRTDKIIAEWWDEDAREMFEQGFFKPGDIRQQTITGGVFEESVLDYAESVGILAGGKFLPQTVKDAYYWTAINTDTGEIVESTTPYTSSGRALKGGETFVSRHWKGYKALVEVWRQPFRYSESLYAEKLKIQPVTAETIRGDGKHLPQVHRRASYVPTSYPTMAAEMEQKYSLEQLRKMAREKGLPVTGTKREIIHALIKVRAGDFARELMK